MSFSPSRQPTGRSVFGFFSRHVVFTWIVTVLPVSALTAKTSVRATPSRVNAAAQLN
jgi:hypothetical protein